MPIPPRAMVTSIKTPSATEMGLITVPSLVESAGNWLPYLDRRGLMRRAYHLGHRQPLSELDGVSADAALACGYGRRYETSPPFNGPPVQSAGLWPLTVAL